MYKEFIVSELKEAKKELEQMIGEIEKDTDCDFNDYFIEIQHIYHHINKAWNMKKEDKETIKNCSEKDFFRWSKFPSDIAL